MNNYKAKFFTNNFKENKQQSNLQFLKNKEMSNNNMTKNNIPKNYETLLCLKNKEHALTFTRNLLELKVKNKTDYCKKNNISRSTLNSGLDALGIKSKQKGPKRNPGTKAVHLRTSEDNLGQKVTVTKHKGKQKKHNQQSIVAGNLEETVVTNNGEETHLYDFQKPINSFADF